MNRILALACLCLLVPCAYADQGGFSNAGGSLAGGSTTSTPSGTLTISGSSLSFVSSDGTTSIGATFSTSSTVESCSGGGRGGHVTCSYTFTGNFSGTLTANGATEAINGSTYQVYSTSNVVEYGVTGYNSAYTPFYFSNSGYLLRSDDIYGTNLSTYGSQGSGVGQFYGANSLALDSAGRIYIADTYNGRVVRIDDFKGTNWTSYGTWGSGTGQFMSLMGISLDPSGHIYVMDTGNNRLVRMDDMNGTNWTVFNATGSGTCQLSSYVAPVAFDSSGRLYFADAGNSRIVRMDDLNCTNWTTLSQSPVIGSYIYLFASPSGIAFDTAGRIYVLDDGTYEPSVVRVDDMTGANWTTVYVGVTANSIAVDASGMVVLGGDGVTLVDNMTTLLTSSSALTQAYGPAYTFGVTPIPVSSPLPSAISLTPASLNFSQDVGSTSPAQTVTIANFGGSPLQNLSLSTTGVFAQTNTCASSLSPGSTCTASVTFTPGASGPTSGDLVVTDASGNLGSRQQIHLGGTGTTPAATVSPTSLSFFSQVIGTTSNAQSVTLKSTGTGPLVISSIAAAAPYSQTNNCGSSLAAGTSCTIQLSFAPTATGSAPGTLSIVDNAGAQSVSLTGSGTSPLSFTPASLGFGSVTVGTTSSPRSVSVSNRLKTALSITSIAASAPFTLATNTCGSSIAANGRCSLSLTFTPTAKGSASGTLTFTDGAVNSPQTVNLSGSGR